MGYVAYAVGTLIAALAIHSFYKARFSASTDEEKNGHVHTAAPEIVVSQSKEDSRGIEQTAAAPLIAIETTRDDDAYQQKDDISSASDRSDSPPRTSHATQRKGQGPKAQEASPTQSPKVQSQDMPPPPRPSSAPNLNSAAAQARQRATMPPPSSLPPSRARSPPRLKPATASLAPSPRPGQPQGRLPAPTSFSSKNNSLAPRPSSASTLRVPAQKALANTNMQPSLAPSTSTQAPSKRSSKKVMLAPGHSPLDWAALTRSTSPTAPTKLRGNDATTHLGPHRLGRITPSQLKYQNGRKGKDAWTVYQGKVYNVSAYLDFHPGGRDELMKGAGRSSDALFAEVHPWVNWDGMLQGCMIGMLVGEDDAGAVGDNGRAEVENDLDEMD
ncbi:hypothetical protein LTR70_010696 [Exophiala xenobiotica]|uniref:Cytochrome b5 heme-binding domain-containing protein n=1 Tax=Lithohypha guttulata TaxID=1690604 RepID=A0ABR0JU00_9EURO|nr:hypothetical protein LTR24_010678 [Lithohypha guttulata]KAK5308973.1 hypothetical protein LTR70_010696 [Exophiala xenobiotica]